MTADIADLLTRWKRLEAARRVWESHCRGVFFLCLEHSTR